MKFILIEIYIFLKFVLKGSIGSRNGLCRTGDKPLPVPMMTCFTDAYDQQVI